jgi:hypothetical protein
MSGTGGMSQETTGSQSMMGNPNAAGGTFTDNSMDQELDNQAHISSDVFGDKNGLQNTSTGGHVFTSPGIEQKLSEKRRLSTEGKHHTKQKSMREGGGPSQSAVGSSALGGAAIGGANMGGASSTDKGVIGQQPSTTGQTGKGMTTQARMSGVPGGGLTQAIGQRSSRKGLGQGGMGGMGGMNQGPMTRRKPMPTKATRSVEDAGMASGTPRTMMPLGSSSHKVTVLQEKVHAVSQKCKTQLGGSASEVSQRSPTVDAFFDSVAAERLRWMPPDGSRLDCCLRWASRLAYAVDNLRESIGAFAPGANEAAKLIWGFETMLLEVS